MDRSLCAVHGLDRWLAAAGITEGPLFRGIDRHARLNPRALSDRSVALIVQRCPTARLVRVWSSRLTFRVVREGRAERAAYPLGSEDGWPRCARPFPSFNARRPRFTPHWTRMTAQLDGEVLNL